MDLRRLFNFKMRPQYNGTNLPIISDVVGFVNHGSTAGTARPSGYAMVIWYGTVQPTNMSVGDLWIDVT